jgi:hypothetical protein
MAITDNFNRSDSGTLGANWTDTASGYAIVSNTAQTPGGDCFTYYSASSWNAAHTSQVTYVGGGAVTNGGPTVRHQAGGNCYVLYLRESSFVRLYYYDGSFNLLQDYGIGPTTTRTYKLEVSGTTLKAYENGVQIGTDESHGSLSNGGPGLYGGGLVFDDWEGTGEAGGVPIGRQLCS